jgi:stage 0 sporulation protein B (sporulation initiation phosphotransferase)
MGAVGLNTDQMADLLRRVRHDFANQLQVISGYLELGQPDRVRDYLQTVIKDMKATRIVFDNRQGEAALYFYEQLLQAQDMGIKLRYVEIVIDDWEFLKNRGEPVHSMALLPRNRVDRAEDGVVCLSIQADERGVDLRFSYPGGEQSVHVIRVNKE